MKKILIVFAAVLMGKTALAQPSSFSTEPAKFLDQVISYLGDEDKKTAKEFKEKFEPVWLNEYTDGQKSQVYKIANAMLAKAYRPFPEFYDLFESLYGFKATKQPESSFQAWISMIDKGIAAKERKQLPELLKMSAGLFSTGIFMETNAIKWKARSKNYKFEYDKQPRIVFESLDLICYAKGDSSIIKNTSGTYMPVGNLWEGKGGTVDWSRPKLDPKETYAEVKSYRITMKTAGYDMDSVLFHTPYFKKPLAGVLIEKIGSVSKGAGIKYPQFNSYSKRLFIKDYYPGVDYEGGFSVQGKEIVGSGTTEQPGKIIFYRNGKPFLKVASTNLTLRPEDVTTDKAFIAFYLDKDSLYHPGINFKYIKSTNTITMVREGQGIVMSPFYDTYHNLELSPDAVKWKTDEPIIEFQPYEKSSNTTASFASVNYFIPPLYDRLQGIGNRNPIYPISEIALRKDTAVLRVEDVASFMNNTVEEAEPILYEMSTMGLLVYDKESGMVTVKPKLKDFAEARAKKKDYDPLIFESDIKGINAHERIKELKNEKAAIAAEMKRLKEAGSDFSKQQKDTIAIGKDIYKLTQSIKNKKSSNAVLDLSNLDLNIYGLRGITLSDSQYVKAYPATGEVVVKQNRSFVFSGAVVVGSTEFFGNNLSYEYAENKINLPQADSMRLRVFPFGAKRGASQIRVTSVIRNVRGSILLDLKDNKSGNKKGNQAYPILDCVKESYVYYNKKSTYGGVYDSSKFFFKIAPFKMDSLDNFKASGVNLAGDFYSAGILPPMKESLKVQKDYSLGFIRKAPPEGFSMYGDKAKFNNEIRLSDKGLQADGELNYLTSFAESKDFVLFPDSVTGLASRYENKEQMIKGGLDVPKIDGKDVHVCFVPKQKVFHATTVETSMKSYREQADYRGTFSLRPEGMTARGRFIFGTAEMKAKTMKCKSRIIDSDTASFKLKSMEEKNVVAFKTENVNAHIDFDKRLGEFKSNGGESFVEFPENKYICYMDKFKWFMDNEDIQLESDKRNKNAGDISIDTDLDLSGSNFYSVHPDQDSLNFMAPKARFDIKKKVITCEKVDYLTIADARIMPDSNKVTIRKNAAMDELKNAKIVANYITKYHSIFNATVKVQARRKYQASGDYTYVDENKFEQKIHFANISPDSTFQTFAKGEVSEKEKFALSPNFEYKGKVILKAADIGLNFDGYTRIAHQCKDLNRNWFYFKGVIDPQNIQIPISGNLLSDNNKALGSGIYVNLDTLDVIPYAAFLSEKQNAKNPELFAANGFLVFDKASQEYRIGSQDKLKELSLPGNYISLKKDKCDIYGDGKMTFLNEPNLFRISTIGSLDFKAKQTEIKASMMFDFPFNDNLLEKFAEKVNDYPDPVAVEIDKTPYIKALREILGLEKADKVQQDINLYGEIKKWPPELAKAIFITDITLKYNPIDQKYVSTGKIGLGHLFKKEVFKYISGRIEIKKTKKQDLVTIYLEMDESNFFYFKYDSKTNVADVYFSDESLNATIQEAKDDKKKFKGEKGEKDFEYRVGSKGNVTTFRNSE